MEPPVRLVVWEGFILMIILIVQLNLSAAIISTFDTWLELQYILSMKL